MDTLFSDVTVVTFDKIQKHAYVGVENGKIAYIGDKAVPAAQIIDGRDRALLPGLVNAHTHISMAAFRGWGDGHNLQDWLNDYIFPYEDKMTAEQAAICAELCLAEAIAAGTTAVLDMYYFYEKSAEVFANSGINCNLSRSLVAFGDWDARSDHRVSQADELFDQWDGFDNGRVKVFPSIHAEYTSNEHLWRGYKEHLAAKNRDHHLHIHLSETRREHDECVARHGKTPAELFDSYGLLDRAVLAHGVYLTKRDGEILAKNRASLVHNPVSNLKLASGVAPLRRLLDQNINVALGTDGVSSNDNMDLFEELKLSAILHRGVTGDPLNISAGDALKLATQNGAAALDRPDTGKLEVGAWADLILLDFSRPQFYPRHDERALAVYAARGGDVCLTMARGRILYRDGEWLTIDIERVRHKLNTVVSGLFA
ncbi:5-methylthioadenosine/S-adenosylhomocysteine deaminase [Clostridia bacterium]|nr:5-methylthioadenosine/S-adenosylhomocysteine deaminase [Clostridia bacterium]